MVTVSQIVKKIIAERSMLQEALIEGIVSFANLAEYLEPRIENELGEKVKTPAIVMALRRHAEQLQEKTTPPKPLDLTSEIVMKTNLCDVTIVKTLSALDKLKQLHKLVDYEKGEQLNIIQGNYEITIVISQKYLEKLKKLLKGEKILNEEIQLVSLTITLTKEFLYTPGILSMLTRKLAWENINIFENISTMTEVIYIIAEKDAMRAYNTFKEILKTAD